MSCLLNCLFSVLWRLLSRSALLKVISGFFSAAEISDVKTCLLTEFDSFLTERGAFTVRPAQEAELEGIIGALELVDSAKDITFVAMDLNRLPGKGTGNANICNSYGVNETIIYV